MKLKKRVLNMPNFPLFATIDELRNLLSQEQFQNLTQLGDDGTTHLAQIVNHIHALSNGAQALEGALLADFASIAIDNGFDFNTNNQPDVSGFTPLGHLFKNFIDNKSAKQVFRKIVSKEVEIDWYQNTKLNVHDEATGPALMKVLTQTHPRNVLKRLNECKEASIAIDFDLLQTVVPTQPGNAPVFVHNDAHLSFAQHLTNQLNQNGISIESLKNLLPALQDAEHLETFISSILTCDLYNAKPVLDIVNKLDIKLDAHKLPLAQIFTNIVGMLNNSSQIAQVIHTTKVISSIHEGEVLDVNHLFNIAESQVVNGTINNNARAAMTPPSGPSLVTMMLKAVQPHNAISSVKEILSSFASNGLEVDLNVRDSNGFSGWQYLAIKIFSNNMGALQAAHVKKIFKDLMQIESLPKEELVSLFMRFMPIDEVVNISAKHQYTISFNKTFPATLVAIEGTIMAPPQVNWMPNIWPQMPQRDTSLIDMLFSIWSQPDRGIRDTAILKQMKAIDARLDLSHIHKAPNQPMAVAAGIPGADAEEQEFGILDCIATDHSRDAIIKIAQEFENEGLVLPMATSTAKKLAIISKFPTVFKQVAALKMFTESTPAAKAVYLLNIAPDDFDKVLSTLVDSEMKIDFSSSIQKLINFIEGSIEQQNMPGMPPQAAGMPPMMMHHNHSFHTLDKILATLASEHVTLGEDRNMITPQILQNRNSLDDVVEILNILAKHEQKFPCDLQAISQQIWQTPMMEAPWHHNGYAHMPHQLNTDEKALLLDVFKLFKQTPLDWIKLFGALHHGAIQEDIDLFVTNIPGIEANDLYKGMLLYSNQLGIILPYLSTKVANIVEITDEAGNTGWHFIAQNPILDFHNLQRFGVQLNATNHAGETVFARLIDASVHSVHVMEYLLNHAWHLIEIQNVDVNQRSVTGKLALNAMVQNGRALNEALVARVKPSGEPWFNVNLLDAAGNRVIDCVAINFKNGTATIDVVNMLRRCGSVEPKQPIQKKLVCTVDVSNDRLEEYGDNKPNAVKLVELMYEQHPLTDAEIDKAITDFKARDFGRIGEIAFKENDANVTTIQLIIDSITGDYQVMAGAFNMGRALEISYKEADMWVKKYVDCKKMIGTMIHMVNKSPDLMIRHPHLRGSEIRLDEMFIYCLTSLKACSPGKLVNLMSVAQEALLDSTEVNYMNEAFTPQYVQLIRNLLCEITPKFQLYPKAIIKWIYDLTTNIDHPENWSGSTQIIQGALNHLILAGGIAQDGVSYHFSKILCDRMLPFAHEIHPAAYNKLTDDMSVAWLNIAAGGVTILANEFCAKVVQTAESGESIEELFENATTDMALAFGNFSIVQRNVFLETIAKLPENKVAEFLVLLIDNFDLGEDVVQVLSERLIAQTRSHPNELAEALETNFTVVQSIDASEQSIMQLLDFVREKQIEPVLKIMTNWTCSSVVEEVVAEPGIVQPLITDVITDEFLQEVIAMVREEMADALRLAAGAVPFIEE